MTTAVIVQARMGSTRLPGKVMMDLGGLPALCRVLDRASQIRGVDRVIMATHKDFKLCEAVQDWGYEFLITNGALYTENDVLSRYYEVVNFPWEEQIDTIVRITADCPLLDPEVSSRVVDMYKRGGYDYVSNCHPPSWPDGLDTEVISVEALCRAWAHAKGPEREHVTQYVWRRPYKFRLGNLMSPKNLSAHRWTLDTPEDLAYIKRVYEALGDRVFGMDEVLALPFSHTSTSRAYV